MLISNSEVIAHFLLRTSSLQKIEECHLLSLKLNSPIYLLLSAAEAGNSSALPDDSTLDLPAGGAGGNCQARGGGMDCLLFVCFLWASFQLSL